MATKSVFYSDPSTSEPEKVKVVEGDPADEGILSVELPSGAVAQVAHVDDALIGAASWSTEDPTKTE